MPALADTNETAKALLAFFLEGLGATALLLTLATCLLLGHVDILLSSEVSCLTSGGSPPWNRLR